jgi:hypothetical protein
VARWLVTDRSDRKRFGQGGLFRQATVCVALTPPKHRRQLRDVRPSRACVGRSDINHTALAFVATADGGVLKTLLVRIGARAPIY